MRDIQARIGAVRERIRAAERRFGRPPGSVTLVAVSKTRPADDLRTALTCGQRRFGENYVQEAVAKMDALDEHGIEWHFIGPIQANKTKTIAARFDWVHSIDRLKVARRLNDQRPETLPPLNVCLQVNISREPSKSGALPDQMPALAAAVAGLPRLALRGLMAIPAPCDDFGRQREPFRRLRELLEALNEQGLILDTLSMGMSNDLEAAVAEGATLVRIGTDIFGGRPSRP